MCMQRKRTGHGLKVVKAESNWDANLRVKLTRKTTKEGDIKYGVVVKGRNNIHTKLKTYDNILDAWTLYKQVRALGA